MIRITNQEIEEALSKLLFNVTAAIKYKPYEKYKNSLKNILKILNMWISYYVDNGDLLKITDNEVNYINKYFDEIPFEAYNGDYYEEIDTWLTVVIFYGSCPTNVDINENEIIRKGRDING